MMSQKWEISVFTVSAGDTILYANGLMQVGINVAVKAVYKNGAQYMLTFNELLGLELIDYNSPDEKLSDGWTYTVTENDFAHTAPGARMSTDKPEDTYSNQRLTYWLSTTKLETKDIGARIKDYSFTWVNTSGDKFDSSVRIRTLAPVRISLNNTEWVKDEVQDVEDTVKQDNYYLVSKQHPFQEADVYGGLLGSPIKGMVHAFNFWPDDDAHAAYISYIWPWGPRDSALVGVTNRLDGEPIDTYRNWSGKVDIRARSNTVCLTHVKVRYGVQVYASNWDYYAYFSVRDIYGNEGWFDIDISSDHTTLIIHEMPDSEVKARFLAKARAKARL